MTLGQARTILAAAALLAVAGCGDAGGSTDGGSTDSTTGSGTSGEDPTTGDATGDTTGAVDDQAYYDGPESAALGVAGNQARCSTCHSNDGTQDGISGNTFKDIAFHTSFKGGEADLLGGVNACVVGWMGGTALTADDAAFLGLKAYMESISAAIATEPNAIAPEVLADEAAYEAAYAGGDAAAGASKYANACAVCHDNGLLVGSTAAYPKATLAGFTVGRIAQKVRTAGPPPSGTADPADSTPGPMPFFEPKDLAAADLADIIAHIKG